MRGSLIITFEDIDGFGGDYLDVYVNNVLNKRIYYKSNSLYSCPLYVGDIVDLKFFDFPVPNTLNFNVYRRDYTTDDESGDNGIKTTLVNSGVSNTGVTFTATTLNISYDFEYRLGLQSVTPTPTPTPTLTPTITPTLTPTPTFTPTPTLTPFTCFDIGTGTTLGFNNQCYDIQKDSYDNLFIGGQFTNYKGSTSNYFIKLDSNGIIDTSFVMGSGFNNLVRSSAIQSNNKLIIGGLFTSYSGNTYNRIIRLNSDGSIDNTFTIGTGFNLVVDTIVIQSDGKIIVSGNFTSYNGNTVGRICRLNSDGTLDTSFNSGGSGFNNYVFNHIIQSDGKIIVGGTFTSYNGTTANRIIRLNSDGSIDSTFVYGTGFAGTGSNTDGLFVDNNNKLMVSGNFTSYNGTSAIDIIRLNSDGTIDNTFNTPSTTNGFIRRVQQLSDGKYLIAGGITNYSGSTVNGLVKLNYDGTIDNSFAFTWTYSIYPSTYPYYFVEMNDNTIVSVGDFYTLISGIDRGRISKNDKYGNPINCT